MSSFCRRSRSLPARILCRFNSMMERCKPFRFICNENTVTLGGLHTHPSRCTITETVFARVLGPACSADQTGEFGSHMRGPQSHCRLSSRGPQDGGGRVPVSAAR